MFNNPTHCPRPGGAILHTVTVTGYSSDGAGVARLPDGRAVFVKGAARDDVCEITLTAEAPRFARGEIVRLITPSPHRAPPDCPVYGDCGGCQFRHITYEEELNAKLRRVNDALERIGGAPVRADEILTAGQTDGYRNRAALHTKNGITGFYRAGSHEIVPVDRCLLLSGEVTDTYQLDGLTFQCSPGTFFQVNTGAAPLLFQKAREYAALQPDETLLDLYCGAGALTLFLGRGAGRAVGVDVVPAAIGDAKQNALRNGIGHAEFICADAADWDADGLRPDCIVADPPRKGLTMPAVRKITELSPPRVVYVSCNPATLARDIKLLDGYKASKACAVDMFPRTAHVECCVLLERAV
jgi:tRNA/tmRNA/rRNA uracil-C5-methylase (TrmA/RlmC/RlmD family)